MRERSVVVKMAKRNRKQDRLPPQRKLGDNMDQNYDKKFLLKRPVPAAVVTTIILLTSMFTYNELVQQDTFYCEALDILQQCDALSDSMKTCYSQAYGDQICWRGKWIEVDVEVAHRIYMKKERDRVQKLPPQEVLGIVENSDEWDCEGDKPQSRCKSRKGKETFYGELR